jgi:hypothetical protein
MDDATMRQAKTGSARDVRFIFYIPMYQPNSNGVRVLYLLGEITRKMGFDVQVVASDHAVVDVTKLPARYERFFQRADLDFSSKDVRPSDIVVYADTVSDNPLAAARVVRYLCNRPFVLTGAPVAYGESDFVASYSSWVDPHAFRLFLLNDDRHLFYPADVASKESLALIYFGKKPTDSIPREVKRFLERFETHTLITRQFPKNRLELGNLLRRARVLVSFDPLTNLCYEATLCNTPALLVNDDFGLANSNRELPTWGFFTHPCTYEDAAAEVTKAYPAYEQALAGNDQRVRAFVQACVEHFAAVDRDEALSRRYSDLNRLYIGLRQEVDRLRFETVHGNKTITGLKAWSASTGGGLAGYAPPPPPGYEVVDALNRILAKVPRVHSTLRRGVSRILRTSKTSESLPLRHRTVDALNEMVMRLPLLKTELKRSLSEALWAKHG